MQEQAKLRELILDTIAEGVIVLDVEGNHTFVNPAAARMLGYEIQELIGKNGHSIWHHTKPDKTPCSAETCSIQTACKGGVALRATVGMFWTKNGLGLPVEFSIASIYEEGHLTGSVLVFTDITQRQKLQQALKQAEALQELLPICAGCKKIRDETGKWHHIETYISQKTGVGFSHGLCPDCIPRYFPPDQMG
jgi:PAS domain S-box-containing protein